MIHSIKSYGPNLLILFLMFKSYWNIGMIGMGIIFLYKNKKNNTIKLYYQNNE